MIHFYLPIDRKEVGNKWMAYLLEWTEPFSQISLERARVRKRVCSAQRIYPYDLDWLAASHFLFRFLKKPQEDGINYIHDVLGDFDVLCNRNDSLY